MLYSDNAKAGVDATAPVAVTPALADGAQQRLADGTQQPLDQLSDNHPEIHGSPAMRTAAGNDTRAGGSPAGVESQHLQLNLEYHRGGNTDEGAGAHGRTRSDGTGVMHEQSPPAFSPKNRSNTNIAGPLGTLQRRGSAPGDRTPPMIRQVHSEIGHSTRRGKHGGSSSSNSSYSSVSGAGITAAQQDDSSKNGYALWMPWEEEALATWLYEPENCKLFNVPRRKKECHERIIREILPRKTSRAIEGKIRTMEKRYLRAAAEIRLPNFETKHQGKSREDVAESMCNFFKKLDIVFNPLQAQAHSHVAPTQKHQQQQQRVWNAIGSSAVQSITPVPALPVASISIPRSTSPPRISVAESMPMPYQINTHGRKIAPKRGAEGGEGGEGGDDDLPVMMSSSKRSRTLPAILQTRQSPGNVHHHHHHQQTQLPHQHSQLSRQHQQLQQAHYEGSIRHAYDAGGRPSIVAQPMIPMASPGPSAGAGLSNQSIAPLTANTQQRHNHQLAATGGVRDTHDTGRPSIAGAVQGTREELDWLQFNLRREELEFRKHVFANEQELENKRMLLEERRLENLRRETDLERERLGTRRQEVDMQLETLRSLTTLLGHIVGHGGSTVGMSGVPAQQPLSRIDPDRQSPVAAFTEPHPDSPQNRES
ncbi:hypothetical protein COEREDRAFT_80753 [Coemansia reversa NRRL 1564]|uniref:Uncharacterized protein n=1 Tax=Coemansia reversa (strain ATCC 12441 / NRRL 1564) TaxID=763665 RepID=A0A2G5BDE5_COERN|nr:hypothetical protein COEREDRAFT_80753 [Coemansia reversa NRRL 1564]|eukprot:PIA17036.1 hypothetical protein COEREDRAFT_80753 [Coemansia reversa NRRL 1564]